MGHTVWVNGSLVAEDEPAITAFDHGLTVGDGVFETTKITTGVPYALTRHLLRLQNSAQGLGLPEPDLDLVRRGITEVIEANATSSGVLRITYTAGIAPLGSGRGDRPPTLIMAIGPAPQPERYISAVTVPWPRNERGALTGLKTTSYAEHVRMLARAHAAGADEAILANTVGNLCEGTSTNVFVGLDGELITPPCSAGILPGITRALVLEWVDAKEMDLPLSILETADEILLTSSVRGVRPVHQIDGRRLAPVPGPLATAAMATYAERSSALLDP